MPVTARLSRAFYERLGDDIANELVDWFNAVDLTYRTELRELNELNFARFDAKVGERLAELRAELLTEMDSRFAKVDVKLAELRAGLVSEMEARFAKADVKLAELRAELLTEMSTRFADADGKLAQRLGNLKASTIRWMFVFWAGTGAMVIGWLLASRS